MFERFSERFRKAMAVANQEAQRFNHEYVGTEHMLLGLVEEEKGDGARLLKRRVDLRVIRPDIEKLVRPGPEMDTMGRLPLTPRARKVVEYAVEEARHRSDKFVGTQHLLLGLLRERDGVAGQVLLNRGFDEVEVRNELKQTDSVEKREVEAALEAESARLGKWPGS